MLATGTMVGEFRIVELAGRGGMGAVYRATQPSLGNAVAIKVLNADRVWDPAAVERFEQEARTVAALRHPGIVSVYSFGELADGRRYYVMELLEGETVKQRIANRRRLDVEQTVRVITEVASALDAAHAQGVIHRDVKPSNIFLQRGSSAKLLDFGVAKLLGARDSGITDTSQHPGTPQYMSPEQAMGQRIDQRSDIYSLALVAFESLTGVSIFGGKTPGQITLEQQTAEAPPLSRFVPDLGALDAAFANALSLDPAKRPAHASDFARMLASAAAGGELVGRGDDATPPSEHGPLPVESGAAVYSQETRSLVGGPALRRAGRRTAVLVGLGVFVVAAVAATVGALVALSPSTPSNVSAAIIDASVSRGLDAGSEEPTPQIDSSSADALDATSSVDVVEDASRRTRPRKARRGRHTKKRREPKIIDDLIRF